MTRNDPKIFVEVVSLLHNRATYLRILQKKFPIWREAKFYSFCANACNADEFAVAFSSQNTTSSDIMNFHFLKVQKHARSRTFYSQKPLQGSAGLARWFMKQILLNCFLLNLCRNLKFHNMTHTSRVVRLQKNRRFSFCSFRGNNWRPSHPNSWWWSNQFPQKIATMTFSSLDQPKCMASRWCGWPMYSTPNAPSQHMFESRNQEYIRFTSFRPNQHSCTNNTFFPLVKGHKHRKITNTHSPPKKNLLGSRVRPTPTFSGCGQLESAGQYQALKKCGQKSWHWHSRQKTIWRKFVTCAQGNAACSRMVSSHPVRDRQLPCTEIKPAYLPGSLPCPW